LAILAPAPNYLHRIDRFFGKLISSGQMPSGNLANLRHRFSKWDANEESVQVRTNTENVGLGANGRLGESRDAGAEVSTTGLGDSDARRYGVRGLPPHEKASDHEGVGVLGKRAATSCPDQWPACLGSCGHSAPAQWRCCRRCQLNVPDFWLPRGTDRYSGQR